MSNEIEKVIESLAKLSAPEDVSEVYAVVDRLNAEGRTTELLELAAAIERACDATGAAKLPYEAVADHVEEVLALTAGKDHVDAVLGLLAKDRTRSVQRPRPLDVRVRAFASRLAHGQSKDTLLSAIARAGDKKESTEVLACWVQESVLRGAGLDGDEVAVAFQAKLAAAGHPLGSLPLALLEAESEAPTYMPMYGENAISKAVQRLASGPTSARTMPPPGEQKVPAATPIEDAALVERLREAVVPWAASAGSNGKAEAKVFRLDPPLNRGALGRWLLRALPLESLEGETELSAERCNVAAVWGALFAAAANGGAYTTGLGGAYGRRAAWTSLAALVDAPALASLHEIDEQTHACGFMMFSAPAGGWWNDIAWDIGVLAVREGGATVAVLAATDAD